MATVDIIRYAKMLIDRDNLEDLQIMYDNIDESNIPWDYVYQKLYIHACLKKKMAIVTWFETLFQSLSPTEQIAVRQSFAYGRYLLNRK